MGNTQHKDLTGTDLHEPKGHQAGHKAGGADDLLSAPGAIGGTTPADAAFAALVASGLISANGGQIKFPATANPSADANTLDDYEEGTWTPLIRFGGASVGQTYSVQDGAYTKVGNKVTVTAQLLLTAKGSSTGDATITGLPFTCANGNAYYSVTSNYTSGIDFEDALMGRVGINSTTILLSETTNAGAVTNLDNTDFVNNSRIFFSATYFI